MGWPRIEENTEAPKKPLRVRLLWMVAIWAASVAALLLVGGVIKLVLGQ